MNMSRHCLLFVCCTVCLQMLVLSTAAHADITCRDSWLQDMPYDEFVVYSCSKCFVQVFWDAKDLSIIYPPIRPYLLIDFTQVNITYFPDPDASPSQVCERALTSEECKKWRSCCHAARRCCSQTQQYHKTADVNDTCPSTWDGISCWGATPDGQQAHHSCPNYYVLDEVSWTSPNVFRQCTDAGTWQVKINSSQEFSDYDDCFNITKNLHVLRASLYVSFVGNGISIIVLITAIIVIVCFRNLRTELQQRTGLKIHFNLFVSVLCTASFTVAFHSIYHDAFTSHNPVYQQNTIWCRVLHILTKYFKSTTYMCMFCEGLFLYRRISKVMLIGVKESLPKYLVISWGVPMVTIGVYVVVRLVLGHNETCWIDDSGLSALEYIHMIPNLCSLVCNLVFLISIEYMLCTKMRADPNDRRVAVFRHALRATISLIPIFGLQFLFLIYRPRNWPPYEIIVAIFVSTQGTLVAILYCFTTKEVKKELSSQIRACRSGRRDEVPLQKPRNASRINGRSPSTAAANDSTNVNSPSKRWEMLRERVRRLRAGSRRDQRRKHRGGPHVAVHGVCLEAVRRDSSESRTTQQSCTSITSSVSQYKVADAKKNGYTKPHHSGGGNTMPLEAFEMQLQENGVQSHQALIHVPSACAEPREPDITTPLVSARIAASNADNHVIDRRVHHILSPIDETESHGNSES